MMSASSIPRFLVSVTNPARSECAEYPDAFSRPADRVRRCTMLLIAAAVIGASRVTVSPLVTCSQTAAVAVGRSRAATSSQSSRRVVGFQSESGWLAIGTHTEWSGDAFVRGSCSTRPSLSSDRWWRPSPASSERRSAPYQPTNNRATSRIPATVAVSIDNRTCRESLGSERVGLILVGAQAAADRLERDSDPGVFGGVLIVEVAGGDGGDGDQLVDRGEAAADGGIGGAATLEGTQVGGDHFGCPPLGAAVGHPGGEIAQI